MATLNNQMVNTTDRWLVSSGVDLERSEVATFDRVAEASAPGPCIGISMNEY